MADHSTRAACAGAVVALVAASGCAVRGPRFASRFVTPGEPSVTLRRSGAPKPPPAPPLSDYMRKIRRRCSRSARPKNSFLPTIESTEPGLSQRLLVARVQPGAETHRPVAHAYRRARRARLRVTHFQRAAALSTCDAPSYDGMARLWRDWGMPDLALSDAYHALRLQSQLGGGPQHAGHDFESLGRRQAAKSAYEKAVALNPRAAFACNNLCYVELAGEPRGGEPVLPGRAQRSTPICGRAQQHGADRGQAGDLVGAEQRLRAGKLSASSPITSASFASRGAYRAAAEVFDQAADARLR